MQDSLFLGFDGGASKTTGVAIDANRKILAEATGGPSNFQIIGTERASGNILSVIEAILSKVGGDFARIETMYLGLTGAGRINDADRMRDGFIHFLDSRRYNIPEIRIGSDAIAALEGAFAGKPGAILISGTGSILFAKDNNERIHRVGGWGRYIGDEGSGYAIGRDCVTAVARQMDGRGKETSLSRLLKDEKGIDNSQAMITGVYQSKLELASLAPLVVRAATGGDEVAAEILKRAARDLAEHVRAILPHLTGEIHMVLSGSVIASDNLLSRSLRQLLQDNFPNIIIQEPEFSPAVGAALLALKKQGPK